MTNERRHPRQQLVLEGEYDGQAGFRSSFLSELSEGGLRLDSSLEPGQRLVLHISLLGFVDPVQVEVEVVRSIPANKPGGPASGLGFLDPSPEASARLADLLDHDAQLRTAPARASRVVLLERQPFLRDVYGQEVRNWAELREHDSAPLDLIAFETVGDWIDEVMAEPASLAIVDVDEISMGALELYRRVRASVVARAMPLIVIGAPESVVPFDAISDDLLFRLRKPLRFGLLMNTVRMLVRDVE